eukprot:s892_g3.t1
MLTISNVLECLALVHLECLKMQSARRGDPSRIQSPWMFPYGCSPQSIPASIGEDLSLPLLERHPQRQRRKRRRRSKSDSKSMDVPIRMLSAIYSSQHRRRFKFAIA